MIIYSFIRAISIAPLEVRYYSEALPTQHGYCGGASRRSARSAEIDIGYLMRLLYIGVASIGHLCNAVVSLAA